MLVVDHIERPEENWSGVPGRWRTRMIRAAFCFQIRSME
jgi:hypothetical protein